ncbi:MAG: ankyrin repeat domain-containing protein [Rickettsiales endosymbiont of Dermacentor nuttalli]
MRDLDCYDNLNRNLLYYSVAIIGSIEVLGWLIRNTELNIYIYDKNRKTILHIVVDNEHAQIVQFLISYNIDINARDI